MRSWKVEGGGLKCTTSVMISSHFFWRFDVYPRIYPWLFLFHVLSSFRCAMDFETIEHAMMFLPLQALFGEAALRSPAPAVNDIHHGTVGRSCSFPDSLDGVPLYAAPWVSVEFRHAPLKWREKKCEKYQNAKSLPHGDPPKVCMASEQPSMTEAKDVKVIQSRIYFIPFYAFLIPKWS